MQRQNIRTLSLVIITLVYLIIGAALFDKFESTNESIKHKELNKNITQFKLKYNMNDTEFNQLWNNILNKKPYGNWKFIGSLYFCTVVVTLIGYGHSTPKTLAGKSFCIFYTLIGVPIFLIMFQSVGERLNSIIVFILSKVKKRFKFKNQEIDMFELITVEFILTLTIVFFASYIFVKNENWSYFDSIYYCLITLLTIGFGDLVPMQKNNAVSNDFTYVSFTILFILTGLTTLASSMNLLVLRLATINAEEQVQIKLQEAEAQAQRCVLEGDIINRRKLFKVDEEKPEITIDDSVSVCSCACFDNDTTCKCKTCCCFPRNKSSQVKNITNINNNNNKTNKTNKIFKNSKITKQQNKNDNNRKFLSYFYESSIVKRLGSHTTNKSKRNSLSAVQVATSCSSNKSNNIEMINASYTNNKTNNTNEMIKINAFSVKSSYEL